MTTLFPEHNIKSFTIEGLYGSKDIQLVFDNNVLVLIGENGLGKTTILNALYYTLTCRFNKLKSLIFNKIQLEFFTGNCIVIDKDDLLLIDDDISVRRKFQSRYAEVILNNLNNDERNAIIENINSDELSAKKIVHEYVRQMSVRINLPNYEIRRMFRILFSGNVAKFEEYRNIINHELKASIHYFPTYRRIEEELHKLGASEDITLPSDDKRLIQFGMEDVSASFKSILENIKSSSIIGFSEITGEMLSQYLLGVPDLEDNVKEKIKPDVLRIILERVGDNIAPFKKERIMQLVYSKEIFEKPDYRYLVNFLSKLVKIYEQQRGIDNKIKTFESICNSYLSGKKVVYNESKVVINVIQESDQQVIELKHLSSGEKQIISLFAKIILDDTENIIVLFDEPELSLSIEWQRKLLPDILKSDKCSFLLAVTHSPFIFDNELDMYAEDMAKYVS